MATALLSKVTQLVTNQKSSIIQTSRRAIYRLLRPAVIPRESPARRMSCNEHRDGNHCFKTQRTNYLKLLEQNPKRFERIKFLGDIFKENGFQLRIAGGAVRDLVNNVEPIDIDLATDAHPDETLKLVEKYPDLFRVIVTTAGQKHGTVAVKFKEVDNLDLRKRLKLSPGEDQSVKDTCDPIKEPVYDDESPYEITTLRCDKLTDGRHADVEFIGDWKKDAERRDLTINSMFLNLDDGKLIDYFGGEQDCKNHIVRFVGVADERLKEDYLRILRFFRFWSRFSRNDPDKDQLDAIKNNLDGLNQISGERIWQELKKTFSHLPCSRVIGLMLNIRLFDYIGIKSTNLTDYKEFSKKVLDKLRSVEANVQDYCSRYLNPRLLENPQDQSLKRTKELIPVIIFSACIPTEELCLETHKRLKFSNLERDTILYILANMDKEPSIEAFKYQLAMTKEPERPHALQRMRAYIIQIGKFEYIEQLESWVVPVFPLKGKEVMKAIRDKKLPSQKTKEVIDLVKLEWAKRGYNLDERELMAMMHDRVNDMARTNSTCTN